MVQTMISAALSTLLLPIVAFILLLGLALVPFSANRFRLVGWHLFRNVLYLAPRVPGMLLAFWKERGNESRSNRLPLPMALLVSVLGLPFVVLLVLMDDYV